MAKKSTMMNDMYINTALLFAWVLIYGLFGEGDDAGLLSNISYLFTDPTGFYSLVTYLSPLAACTFLMGSRICKYACLLPLVWNVINYGESIDQTYGQWYFWVSLVISLYASVKLAKHCE